MIRMQPRIAAVVAIGAALAATTAHADVKYTTTMKVNAGPGGGGISTTYYYKGHNERQETHVKFGPMDMTMVILSLCKEEQTVTLDPDLKIYKVAPIGVPAFAPPNIMRRGAPAGGAGQMSGSSDTTFTIQDLGQETVGSLACTHAKVTIHSVTSGCLGDADRTTSMEIWSAPGKLPEGCPARFQPARSVTSPDGCKMTYTLHGNVDEMKALFGGIIARMKIAGPGGREMTQELTDLSEAPLDDSLFTIPADYKRVSAADFTAAQQKAMMEKMMKGGGFPGGPGGRPTPPAP